MKTEHEFPGNKASLDLPNFQIYPDQEKIEEDEREKQRWPPDPPAPPDKEQEQHS